MSNEITATFGLNVSGGAMLAPGTVQVAGNWVASQGTIDLSKLVGTTEETVESTDITTNGWVHLYNTDATNFVDWGFSTGVYGGRLMPGGRAQFFMKPSATIYIKADTAACRVRCVHVGGV